jgi:hypothetical protein
VNLSSKAFKARNPQNRPADSFHATTTRAAGEIQQPDVAVNDKPAALTLISKHGSPLRS